MRQWLVDIRNTKELTQDQAATLSGISRSFYSEIENGTKDPSVKTAKKIARALGFDWTIFFKDAGRISRPRKTKQSA